MWISSRHLSKQWHSTQDISFRWGFICWNSCFLVTIHVIPYSNIVIYHRSRIKNMQHLQQYQIKLNHPWLTNTVSSVLIIPAKSTQLVGSKLTTVLNRWEFSESVVAFLSRESQVPSSMWRACMCCASCNLGFSKLILICVDSLSILDKK